MKTDIAKATGAWLLIARDADRIFYMYVFHISLVPPSDICIKMKSEQKRDGFCSLLHFHPQFLRCTRFIGALFSSEIPLHDLFAAFSSPLYKPIYPDSDQRQQNNDGQIANDKYNEPRCR
jgi:hypothetical protein